jgi:hypothetical protein
MRRTNFGFVTKVPYFDDINMNDVHTTLEGLIGEVETGPKVTPVS